jgi:hypothetical protein
VVVDVSNSPSFEDAAVLNFFETSTRNLLDAEAVAGVGHHVALSVVGTERLSESGYFRAKIAQEMLIIGSSIPYSIVRADGLDTMTGRGDRCRCGLPASRPRPRPVQRGETPCSTRRAAMTGNPTRRRSLLRRAGQG